MESVTYTNIEVQLEAIGNTTGEDTLPQITAVGSAGEYVVTYTTGDGNGYTSVVVQKFNANGTVAGPMVHLDAIGRALGFDHSPAITSNGTYNSCFGAWHGFVAVFY